MSTQLPAYLLNRPTRGLAAAASAGLGAARPPHISRRGNRFTLVDGAGNRKPVALMDPGTGQVYIDVVIIDANEHPSRMYFEHGYDENNPDPPACWSDNGTGPSRQAMKPQSTTCASCPMAEWSSAVSKMTGAGIPACQSSKKLAVLVPGDETAMIYEFVVPPGSFSDKETGWRRYVNSIAGFMIGQRHADLSDVITRISFVPNSMGVLAFQPVSIITEDLVGRIDLAWSSGQTKKICGMEDVARDPSLPLSARPVAQGLPQGQLPPPPPQTAPQAPPAGNGAAPTPRRRGRPATVAPAPAAALQQPFPPAGTDELDLPDFLKRGNAQTPNPQPVPQPPLGANQAAQQQQPAQFGLQQPQRPNQQLQDQLNAAFNLKT